MEFNKANLLKTMKSEAITAFGDGWEEIKAYAPIEFEKMAVQLVNITKNVALYKSSDKKKGFSPATGKALLKMQRTAMESVFIAVTGLILLTIQKAINAIFKVLKDAFQTVLKGIL
tara:strand:- start:361 stop:708 length:348 start_codon:yes stop_codon:yes gene_type:complete